MPSEQSLPNPGSLTNAQGRSFAGLGGRGTGAGPASPVPAPQTPHLLPSSCYRVRIPPCPGRPRPSSIERPGHARYHLLLKTLVPEALEGRTRSLLDPRRPDRPLTRPSTQCLFPVPGMRPAGPHSMTMSPPGAGGTSIMASAGPGFRLNSPGSLAPSTASDGSASPGHCPVPGSPSPSSGMPSMCCSRPTSWGHPPAANQLGRGVERDGAGGRRGLRAKKRRVIAHLGVDEKAVAKRHRYVTLVCDLDRATVEYIADDRKQASLDAYYQSLSPKQLAGIEAVAMDMWEPFIASTVAHVPDGGSKIVFDRFHIMKHMTEAVDEVRKGEHRRCKPRAMRPSRGRSICGCSRRRTCRSRRREQVRRPACAAPEDRPGVGDQGVAARPVGLPAQGVGVAALETLVLLGDALAVASRWSRWRG